MFPQASSSAPLNGNSNSLTEPLLLQSEQVDIEATSVVESTDRATFTAPVSSTTPINPIVDDTLHDGNEEVVVVLVPTEDSVLSSSSSVVVPPRLSESMLSNHTNDEEGTDDHENGVRKSDTITSDNNERTESDMTDTMEVPDP